MKTEHATFPAVPIVLHYFLIALKLCCNDLVPGDAEVVVHIVWMLLLCLVDFQASFHKHLLRTRREKNNNNTLALSRIVIFTLWHYFLQSSSPAWNQTKTIWFVCGRLSGFRRRCNLAVKASESEVEFLIPLWFRAYVKSGWRTYFNSIWSSWTI